MGAYYPPVGFYFQVDFDFLKSGGDDARFQEVSGLNAEIGIEEITEGGENRFTHRLPTRGKYSNLILKRGLFNNSQLIDWCKDAIENLDFTTTTVNVSLLNESGEPLGYTYSFVNAYPVKWTISDLKSMDNSFVVETLELAYNYFKRIKNDSK